MARNWITGKIEGSADVAAPGRKQRLPVGFTRLADDPGGIFREWIHDEHGRAGPMEPFVNDEQCWAFAEHVAAPFVAEAVADLQPRLDQAMSALCTARRYLVNLWHSPDGSSRWWCASDQGELHEPKSRETCPVCADLVKIDAALKAIIHPESLDNPSKGSTP